YTILFIVIIFCALLTWVVPAGRYDRASDRPGTHEIVPGTYKSVAPSPVGVPDVLYSVHRGMVSSAETAFFLFITFPSISLIVSTGAFHALIARLLAVFKGNARIFVIPLFIIIIGAAASTISVFEEMFAFIPLFVAIAISMGYDALVGMSIVALGIGIGYSGSCLNPFTVGVAQQMMGLSLFSGASYRVLCHFVMAAAASAYVMLYALRISRDPRRSMLHGQKRPDTHITERITSEYPLTARHILVMLTLISGITAIVWGVTLRGWLFEELSAVYLFIGITSGLIMGWPPDKISSIWAEGAREITSTCIKIALAKGVVLIMSSSNTLDTLIYWLSTPLMQLPRVAAVEAMLAVQTAINFFVPSGLGQAAVSIPIMGPLSDALGVSRQTAVLAFQFGDGISNILWITGSMPVICKFAGVSPRVWIRWFIPLFALLYAIQSLCMAVALAIGY
ncbi:MAG: TIGR00366 family protein, partial [Synergistaceae bacterium]|nr:TIGR00366 family protein [Synergistaceae bacterium]